MAIELSKEEKKEFNKQIAYFMGWRIDNSFPDKDRIWRKGNYVELDTTLKFFDDWNILQEVVIAIEDLGYNFYTHQARVLIERNDDGLANGAEECDIEVRSSMVDFDKKLGTYKAVAEFVAWYNALPLEKSKTDSSAKA